MAESTLSLTYDQLLQEVGEFMSIGRDIESWRVQNHHRADSFVQRGYRQFLTPPPVEGERTSHQWSFMRPTTTIALFGDFAGSLTSIADVAKIEDSAQDFRPDTANTGAELVGQTVVVTDVSEGTTSDHVISTVDSDTVLAVTPNIGGSIIVTDTYTIQVDGNYNLPDDFGGIIDMLHFDATTGFPPVEVTSQAEIRERRMSSLYVQTGRPSMAAVRPRDTGSATAGQRFELMVWPRPDTAYTLHYRYNVLVDKLSSSNPYPIGGMLHAETIMASCLAIAEEMADTPTSQHRRLFRQRLAASVAMDRSSMKGRIIGFNTDRSTQRVHIGPFRQLNPVTVNGVQYP